MKRAQSSATNWRKKMKKTKLLAIPVLAALMFAGCGSAETVTNKAPSVVGVKDIQCMVNSTVDFLDGVAALDNEDGDITPELKITVSPHVEVKDGYAYFSEVGEYTVTYLITDSEGRSAQKRAYVDVVDRETYKTFTMPEGFTAEAAGSATIEKCGMVSGEFKLEAKGGEIAEDVMLSRKYTLTGAYSLTDYLQYTFHYTVNSDTAGKIKVLADGDDCAELSVKEGENVLSFMHTVRKQEGVTEYDVDIDVCLGSLGDVKWTVEKVEIEYPQKEGELVERANDFSFAGRVESRIDTNSGTIPLKGNAWAGNGGKTACLEITEACGEIWRGGMFIKTEIALKEGIQYTVSFDIERDKQNNFEILFKYEQWGDDRLALGAIYEPVDGENKINLTVPEGRAGYLWIYVQSGNALNEIRLSNLSVIEELGPVGKDTVAIEDFAESHAEGCDGTLTTERGNFSYTIENFAAVDNGNKVTSPSFFVAGSVNNYVISFKAKASAPVEMVVAAPVFGGWDPTMLWSKITLNEEETVYTFMCYNREPVSDRLYTIVWQFGSLANQKYNGVKIEISDIKVSIKNRELDG